MSTITERVAAGAAFLDEHDDGWWRAIDLDRLDLDSNRDCVLGQRCPLEVLAAQLDKTVDDLHDDDHWRRYMAYARHLSGLHNTAGWADRHGFNADSVGEMPRLTAEWKSLIEARRAA